MSTRCRIGLACVLTFVLANHPRRLEGQAGVPLRGEGTVTSAYQYANVHDHVRGDGTEFQAGRIYSHSMSVQLDYGVTDKLAASFSLPYITSLYKGAQPHNPAALATANHEELIDDGTYHGTIQDLGFGVRYNLIRKPTIAVTPFAAINLPSHDYVFYAHTAAGRNLWQVSLGTSVGGAADRVLPKSYFQVRYGYGITEKTRVNGISYGGNQSLLRGDFGYAVNERLTIKAMEIFQKTHGGLDYPNDFPDRTGELWLHHDQVQQIDYLELGGGFDFTLSRRTDLSASLLRSVWGHNGHSLRMGLSIGLTYYFPRAPR